MYFRTQPNKTSNQPGPSSFLFSSIFHLTTTPYLQVYAIHSKTPPVICFGDNTYQFLINSACDTENLNQEPVWSELIPCQWFVTFYGKTGPYKLMKTFQIFGVSFPL